MRQEMAKIEWGQIMEGKNLEETWETFEGMMKDVVKKYIPCKRITSGAKKIKTPLWMNSNAMSKIKKKNKAYTHFLKIIKNMPKQETKPSGNKKKLSEISKTSQISKKNPKVRQGISDLEKPCGTLTTSDKGKSETLNSFFSSVFTVQESESPAVQKNTVKELLSNVTFTVADVEKRLIALKPDKSPGPDKSSKDR